MSAAKKKLVSIVDDELDITVLFRDALKAIEGVSVFTFTEPFLAVKHFTINRAAYVMIISDLRMPGLNGMELIKKVKALNPFVRTILMTAFAIRDNSFKENAKKEIINGFLQKPIRLDDLCAEVNKQLQTYEDDVEVIHRAC